MKKNESQLTKEYLRGLVLAPLFAGFTAAIASFKIPLGFTPVPITLQTLGVLLAGGVLGPLWGAVSMILYILIGALGLPVFAGGSSGFGVLLGPTGGYLLSYPIAAAVIGWLTHLKTAQKKAVGYAGFAMLALLLSIIYADLAFNIGIMKAWNSNAKTYIPVISTLSVQSRFIIIGGSMLAVAGLVYGMVRAYKKAGKQYSLHILFAMSVGTIIIYILGAVQGKLVTGLSWPIIFAGWVLPFLIGDTIKLLVAGLLTGVLRRMLAAKKMSANSSNDSS